MTMVINGSGTITGLTAGGLPDATIVTADIVDANVTQAKLAANVAGNGPAFSAYANSNTALSAGVDTRITLDVETFDTGGCFNNTGSTTTLNGLSAPAYAFCPNVAGYYQITGAWTTNSVAAQVFHTRIYKNGSTYVLGNFISTSGSGGVSTVSALVYLNGTGDYVQLYATDTVTVGTSLGSVYTYLCGGLVRAA